MFKKTKKETTKRKRETYNREIGKALRAIEREEIKEHPAITQFKATSQKLVRRANAVSLGAFIFTAYASVNATAGVFGGLFAGALCEAILGAPVATVETLALCGALLTAGAGTPKAIKAYREVRDDIIKSYHDQPRLAG